MRFLVLACIFLTQLGASSTIMFVGGFVASSLPHNDGHRTFLSPSSMGTYLYATNNDLTSISPTPPTCDIEPKILLSHAYNELNVQQLRDVLRAKGAKVSGTKRELIIRLGKILSPAGGSRSIQSPEDQKETRRNQNNSFSEMTVKELKDLLRKENAQLSGNKRELVQRLMNINGASMDRSGLLSQHATTVLAQWSILEPTLLLDHGATTTETEASDSHQDSKGDLIELPTLSGLLFVNKPAGYSTLPTKPQLDNTRPSYPCLADEVNRWLRTDPIGQKRLQHAIECEEIWWEFILQEIINDPKQQKKLRRERDGQMAKMLTFDPRPVHRLDIDTSGVVCIALTPYALRSANMLFEKKTRSNDNTEIVQKRYVALVEGNLVDRGRGPTGVVNHPIGKVWIDDHNEWACDISGNGSSPFIRPGDGSMYSFVPDSLRHAATTFRVEHPSKGSSSNTTRVELQPHTGRGHQLRLHMASIGHPIVGDSMHGIKKESNSKRLCLHASELSLDVWHVSCEGAHERFQICRAHVKSIEPF